MTKAELVKHLADTVGITKAQAESVINEIASEARSAVASGQEFVLPDIGKIKVVATAAKEVRNPRTGETLKKKAGTRAKFTFAKAIKDSLPKKL